MKLEPTVDVNHETCHKNCGDTSIVSRKQESMVRRTIANVVKQEQEARKKTGYRCEDCRDNALLSMAYAMGMCIADSYREDGRESYGFIPM